jgi:uncharacterized protein YyaL (SSP411 family)
MNNDQLQALLGLDRTILPPDGGERFNRLVFTRSPYLLQHAENPTDWREWGDEAFAEARRRGVPLLVSIGYATCHWCHVMAHESFSDPEVAAVLNRLYVPIKVDREERPDLDEFYMCASRVLTGSGGWPLNVFVDHDKKPFFAITYLPKLPQSGVPGFISLLENISILWRERPQIVANNAEEISRAMAELAAIPVQSGKALHSLVDDGYEQLQQLFDQQYGGFGISPKFPLPVNLLFLLGRSRDVFPGARSLALQTLRSMARGGIHDQLAGGFHRYAVDRQWLVPHFEKMLYDQALLISTYVEGYVVSGEPSFLETALTTARFAMEELAIPAGGFCAALDADTGDEEGGFYTWTPGEIVQALGAEGELFCEYWGVTDEGHLHGHSILHLPTDPERFAAAHDLDKANFASRIGAARQRLLALRRQRESPLRDPKIICSWNGLMIAALARLARVVNDADCLSAAVNAAGFILGNLVTPDGRLLRSWLGTPAPIAAFAEDYACFCLGLAELAESGDASFSWKELLLRFGGELQRLFVAGDGSVASTGRDTERLPFSPPLLQQRHQPVSAWGKYSVIRHSRPLRTESSLSIGG